MGIKIAGRFSFHPAYVSFCYARSFFLIFISLQSSSSTSSVGFRSSIYAFRAFITSVIYSLISLLSMVKYRFKFHHKTLRTLVSTTIIQRFLRLYKCAIIRTGEHRSPMLSCLVSRHTNRSKTIQDQRHYRHALFFF